MHLQPSRLLTLALIAPLSLWAAEVAIGYTRDMEIKTGINRRRQINLFDPDGTRVEVMEPNTVDGVPVPSSTAPPPNSGKSTAAGARDGPDTPKTKK